MALRERAALVMVCGSLVLIGSLTYRDTPLVRAQNPCTNYVSDVTPPDIIGVGITDKQYPPPRPVLDTVYIPFKTYVKDVLPNEWLANWDQAAYQAGGLAVKTFGWYHTIHWRPRYARPASVSTSRMMKTIRFI
jgi:hypothetical protein